MNSPVQSADVFYLGFHKDTGELVDVVVPKDRELKLDPRKVKQLSLGQLEASDAEKVRGQIRDFYARAQARGMISRRLSFIDEPGQSICCGSCGGIPFCWC